MDEQSQNIFLKTMLTFLVMTVALWTADFHQVLDGNDSTSMALLADDWAIYADLVWDESRPAGTKIKDIFLESWEGRPLRSIEMLGLLAAYNMFGLEGGLWLQLLILATTGTVFTVLLARRYSWPMSLAGALIATLHPADTTHIWLATMMAKLAILYTMFAMTAFCRGGRILPALLLLAAFLSYELSPFVFVMAPFLADGGTARSIKRGAAVFGAALTVYLCWRFIIFTAAAPDVRLIAGETQPFDLSAYALGFVSVLRDTLWNTVFLTPLRPPAQILGILLLVCVPAGYFLTLPARSRPPHRTMRIGILWGFLAIAAGAVLSFRASPNAEIGIASRHNIAAVWGAGLLFCAVMSLMIGSKPRGVALPLGCAVALFAVGMSVCQRVAVQDGYRKASAVQRQLLTEAFTAIGPLPPHTLVVLEHALDRWQSGPAPMAPLITGRAYEIEAICKLVFDKSIVGFVLQDANDHERGKYATAAAIRREESGFHGIIHYDFHTKRSTWIRRTESARGEPLVEPAGPAWDYLRGK